MNEACDIDFSWVEKNVYIPLGIRCEKLIEDTECKKYNGCSFVINNKIIIFRSAKITPKKRGQFVTFWKRPLINGPIIPFDVEDLVDYFVVIVKFKEQLGQFTFPRYVLLRHGIISQQNRGGKRALRVYAPWDICDNDQAKKTQSWQLKYFHKIIFSDILNNISIKNYFF
jgi:hypothetical protein